MSRNAGWPIGALLVCYCCISMVNWSPDHHWSLHTLSTFIVQLWLIYLFVCTLFQYRWGQLEIVMYFIAYNCIRRLMYEAVKRKGVAECRVSFKGSVQAIRQWAPHLDQIKISREQQLRLMMALYHSIADYIVPLRPGRREPRCVKRRPKQYQLLTKPRHEMIETPHRGRYRAEAA